MLQHKSTDIMYNWVLPTWCQQFEEKPHLGVICDVRWRLMDVKTKGALVLSRYSESVLSTSSPNFSKLLLKTNDS